MKSVRHVSETELAEIAKTARQNAGKTRAQAARDMGIRQTSIFHAEESPEKSYTKLRIRMIEAYSQMRITGPVFAVEGL